MKRVLDLFSWNIDSDEVDEDREYDNPTFDDVQRELKTITKKRKVALSDNWEMSIEYGCTFGVLFEVGTSSLRFAADRVAEQELVQRFQWFYDGNFESLLSCEWDEQMGYSPITLEDIKKWLKTA